MEMGPVILGGFKVENVMIFLSPKKCHIVATNFSKQMKGSFDMVRIVDGKPSDDKLDKIIFKNASLPTDNINELLVEKAIESHEHFNFKDEEERLEHYGYWPHSNSRHQWGIRYDKFNHEYYASLSYISEVRKDSVGVFFACGDSE
jgi:hypothetical protein